MGIGEDEEVLIVFIFILSSPMLELFNFEYKLLPEVSLFFKL